MIANGARTTIIMASVIVAAANVLRPRNHLSTRWYSGQVEKHSTTAHSSADTNGHKTRRQPTTTIDRTIQPRLRSMRTVSLVTSFPPRGERPSETLRPAHFYRPASGLQQERG